MCKIKLFFSRLLFRLFSVKTLKNYKLTESPLDIRDYKYSSYFIGSENSLQEKIDLRQYCSAIEDQQTTNSCVSQALVGMLEFLSNKNNPEAFVDLSRLFVYYTTRMYECDVKRDAGSHIRDGIKVLKKYGVCTEYLHPFIPQNYAVKPNDLAFDDAELRKISSYYKIDSLDDMIKCLNSGYVFVGALRLYQNFSESLESGIVPMPVGIPVANHAVMFVGFDLTEQIFLVRNSWGEYGNLKGYFKIPFSYVANHGFDFWTIRN